MKPFLLEEQFLMACTHPAPSPDEQKIFKGILANQIDWRIFFQLVSSHGLVLSVFHRLNSKFADSIPKPFLREFDETFEVQQRSSFRLKEVLKALAEHFPQETPSFLLYKNLSGTVETGRHKDKWIIDLVVRKSDIANIHRILISQGYTPGPKNGCRQGFVKQKWKINLHWDVAQEYKISSLERMSLLPCLENTFLLRCCDGAKQAWKSLGTLHAAAEEALAPEFSWEKVIQQARALKLEKVLKLGLNAIDEVYPHLIPQKIRAYALGNAQMVQVSERIRRWRFQRKRRFAQLWFACCVYLRVLESPLDKARFLSDSLHPLKLARQLFRRYMSVKTDLASFAPTPKEVVQKMLRLAEVTASDVVYDLGCGDGRMVVFAAKMCGARGVGVDIDPKRIQEAEVFAQREQVDHRVEFLRQDVKSIDCSAATVVMLYLPSGAYPLIKPVLEKLRPGTRIVTRTFFVDHLEPVKTETFKGLRGMSHTLYLYVA